MSHFLVLLVLFTTTLFSSLLSPASVQAFSFSGGGGSNGFLPIPSRGKIPSGGVIEVPISFLSGENPDGSPHSRIIRGLCFADNPSEEDCIPDNTELISTNSAVASVFYDEASDELNIILEKPGFTLLQLRSIPDKEILASFVLVITEPLPGTQCQLFPTDELSGIVDCSGTCVAREVVQERLGDGVCDDGRTERKDGKELIDLSCVFPPEFFLTETIFDDIIDVVRINRDAGDCDPEASCTAQFVDAPDFKFCSGTANLCSFNATTGFNTPTGRGTCAAMCQQFGSRCVAALDNNQPGCTPNPKSRDTCETPRQTEICVCEQRFLGAIPQRDE